MHLRLGDGRAPPLRVPALLGVHCSELRRQLLRARVRHGLLLVDARLARLGERGLELRELGLE